jgi:coenzyme F420-dependent glucose-6-phosphate dehydrogenase
VTRFLYHVSHEQHRPSALLAYVRAAEAAGFDGAVSSDHFHPWAEEQGQSGFAWSWLGAAMQATQFPFGIVTAPGVRYHPAIIAQAAATLAEMFPDRFWIAVGSGEALNERITGEAWPSKPERNARLRECVDVMRALWRGETVSHRGRIVIDEAKLYTRPARPPMVFGAALTEPTARLVGGFADGLITTGRPRDELLKMIEAFRRGGGEGKPIYVQHVLSWARTEEEARRVAHEQWRFSLLGSEVLSVLNSPAQFTAATEWVRPHDVAEKMPVSANPDVHIASLRMYVDLGVEQVSILNVHRDHHAFIEQFGQHVLPPLRAQ